MTSWEHGVKFSAQIKMQALLEPAIAPTVFTGLALLVIGHLGYWPLLMTVFNRTWENLWSTDRIQSDLRAKQVEKRGTLVAQQKKFLENGEDLKDIEDQLLQLDFWLAKDFFTNLHPRRDLDFIYQNLDELNEAVTACLQDIQGQRAVFGERFDWNHRSWNAEAEDFITKCEKAILLAYQNLDLYSMNYGQKGFSPNRSRGARGVPALVQLASELRQFSGEVALYLYYMKLKAGLRDEAVDKVIDCLDSDSLLTWESIIAARLRLLTLAKDAVGFAASWPFSYMSTIEELGDLSEGIRHHKLAVRRDMIFSLYLIVPWSLLAVFKQMGWHENTAWYTASLVHDFFSRILAARMLVSWVAVGIRLFQFADFRITADKRLLSYYARKLLKRLIYFAGSLTANLFYYVSVLTSQQQVSELVSKYLEPFGIRPYQRDIVVNLLGGVGQAMHVFLVAMAIGFLLYVVNPIGQAAALSGYLWLGLVGFFALLGALELYHFYGNMKHALPEGHRA